MSKAQQLRDRLKQRLTADDEELLQMYDEMIADYEAKINQLKEEKKGRKVLEAVFNPGVNLYNAGASFTSVAGGHHGSQMENWALCGPFHLDDNRVVLLMFFIRIQSPAFRDDRPPFMRQLNLSLLVFSSNCNN